VSEQRPAFADDPHKDYRQRYYLPDQFVWGPADRPRIDFDGYMAMAADLLPPPPAHILDVGCGPGLGAKRLLERGYLVTGVDYNERAVAFARLLVADATFLPGDIRSMGEVEGLGRGFDAALCVEVLEHVPPEDRERMLLGVGERLRPGGALVITTPSPRMHANPWDYRRPGLEELTGLVESAGFEIGEVRFQHRLSPLFGPWVWRFVSNGVYDLRLARSLLRWLFLRRFNVASGPERAGRFVVRAVRP